MILLTAISLRNHAPVDAIGHARFALVLLAILTVCAGSAQPLRATELTKAAIDQPPGELVDIGSRRLYLYCTGKGSPTVVLDAGLGGSSLEWWAVQQQLATHARVCAYDRAGYGWSDAGPRPRTSLSNAMDLHELLQRADVKPPYLLVGHSFGGYDVQLFASLYPSQVAGLVLVDSSHAGQVERFEAQPIGVSTAPRPGSAMLMSAPVIPTNLPTEFVPTVAALMSTTKAVLAASDELQNFRISAHQVANAAPWPDVPVVVLTRGRRVWPQDEKGELMEALWMELQNELAVRSARSLHIVVRNSGHHIHLDRPLVVSRAVELLLYEHLRSHSRTAARVVQLGTRTTLLAAHTLADDTLFADLHPVRTTRRETQ
jgi:pimeloyl-ACP methyl ester carboxylesterase